MDETHFTYNPSINPAELKQGDVLVRTDELSELIGKYHAHYVSPEYTHFQILTQSCDLVKRKDNKCLSRYITLAAIRSLDTVLKRVIEMDAKMKVEIEGNIYCSATHKYKLSSFLESLFNNNSKEYFFLKSFPERKIHNDSCTFLYLSIAIKAHEHYDLCLRAKCLELDENFRSKLGWMVGNLYSRVGTEDYVPGALPDQGSLKNLIDETLDRYLAWVPEDHFSEFKKAAKPELSFEEIIEATQERIDIKKINKIESFTMLLQQDCTLNPEQIANIKEFFKSGEGSKMLKF